MRRRSASFSGAHIVPVVRLGPLSPLPPESSELVQAWSSLLAGARAIGEEEDHE